MSHNQSPAGDGGQYGEGWQRAPISGYRGETMAPNPTPDASYEYQNASGAYEQGSEYEDQDEEAEVEDEDEDQEEEEGGEEEEEEEEEEERDAMEGDIASETSSAMYDADADPGGFARRQDELAGVMEMREQEARAIRRGPPFGRDRKASLLSISDFKLLVNHHLDETDWKYDIAPKHADNLSVRPTPGGGFDEHPIWIVGPHRSREAEDAEPGVDDLDVVMSGPA